MSVFPTMDGEPLSTSPFSTSCQSPGSPGYFVSVAGTRKSAGLPSLEPLSFSKVPLVSPAVSGGTRSASTSTDCESALSDAGADLLSRSPSLLTSLMQSQARRSARTTPATTPGVSPTSTPAVLPGMTRCGRPILRRCSSGAVTSDDGLRNVSLAALPEQVEASLHRRRSCLKFAVTPRPLQLPSSLTSSSRRPSAGSSRRASGQSSRLHSPRCATPALDEDDEDEDEVAVPAFDSDDAGYQEDSEDGFTSDEDVPTLIPRPAWAAWGKNPALALAALAPAPILSTAARRAAEAKAQMPEPSTDDCGDVLPPPRRRVKIRDDETSARKCTRHRSPPPISRLSLSAVELERAPPAARSPSAADLCRRRSGQAPTPLARSPAPAAVMAAKGWRSDDCVRRPRGVTFEPHRSTSERVPACHVTFDVEAAPQRLRKKCSMMLARRDSAPAAGLVDEVHVLATNGSETPCPLAHLRASLKT